MKYCLGILILLGILGVDSLFAQQANWLWAKSGGGKGRDQVSSLAVDSIGNVFVTGYYKDSATFSGIKLRSVAGNHFFLAKYLSDGTLSWIKTTALKGQSYGTGICLSEGKYIYLTGYFSDSIALGNTILTSFGGNDIFLSKYDLDGEALWGVSAGGTGLDQAKSVASDMSGNVYVTGNFSGAANFETKNIISTGGDDIFIAEYNPSGILVGVKGLGSNGNDAGWGLAVGRSGDVVVTGTFTDTLTAGTSKLIATGTSDIFIIKYSSDENVAWAKQAHDTTSGIGECVAIDPEENVYVTGRFEISGFVPDCVGSGNIYIAKFNSAGQMQWQKCGGSGGEESGDGIAIDSSGNIFVTGGFDFMMNFGAGVIPNKGLIDAYVVKFDPSGKAQWSDHVGMKNDDEGNAVAVDRNGNLYLGGAFSDTVFCGPFELQSHYLTDAFIAKIGAHSSVTSILFSPSFHIVIYPNPARNAITIQCLNEKINSVVEVELISILGVVVRKDTFPQGNGEKTILNLSVNDLPKGMYCCRLSGNGWSESKMFVIGD